jgi:hypothetical protein
MEKKKIKLTLNPETLDHMGGRSFTDPIFAFTTAPVDGKIKTVTILTYCRESFCEYIRQQVRGVRYYGIDLTKLHMIINRKVPVAETDVFPRQVAAGLVMLNTIEKNYGWPLTRAYPVSNDQHLAKTQQFYYITASKRWIKAPAMLSLFTLLLRIATHETKFKFKHKVKTMKSLFDTLDDLSKKCGQHNLAYYRAHGRNWELVLDNYSKLFGSREMSDLYFPKTGGYFFTEGINELCDGSSRDTALSQQFYKMLAKREKNDNRST